MTEKEEKILKLIYDYIRENHTMPSYRIIQKKLNYKSTNSITQYIKSLENKGYLTKNHNNKIVVNNFTNTIRKIKIINCRNKYIEINLNKKKNYLAFKLNNNFFENKNIIKNDILIIEKTDQIKINDIGLFIIDNNFRIMKYDYNNGFYLLKDRETIILNRIKIIGKVIQIIRKI